MGLRGQDIDIVISLNMWYMEQVLILSSGSLAKNALLSDLLQMMRHGVKFPLTQCHSFFFTSRSLTHFNLQHLKTFY